jgi:hypothetical protein
VLTLMVIGDMELVNVIVLPVTTTTTAALALLGPTV